MKEFFKELLTYGHQANQYLWDAMMKNGEKVPEKSVKYYNHILNAHQIWNNRIDPKSTLFGPWESRQILGEREIDQRNYAHTLTILDRHELDRIIGYINDSTGKSFSNSLRDILFHLINHSTYHRGQIASDFRQNGLEPLNTDYIVYKRYSLF